MARGLVASFLGMFVMACSGCGGGGANAGGAQAASSEPASQPVSSKSVLITQWGDSTTDGYYKDASGNYAIVQNPPWKLLEVSLQQKFGPRVTVQFSAQRGSTLSDMINGTGNFTEPLAVAIKSDAAQIDTIRFGLNDEGQYDVAAYKGYLVEAVQIMLAAGKLVVIEEPTPTLTYKYHNGSQYAQAADEVAAQFGLPLVKSYSLTLAVPNWTSMMSDNLHPTQALYQEISNEQLSVLTPIVEKALS